MARLPRLVIPDHPHHVILDALDSLSAFRDEEDHAAFLGWLKMASRQFRVALHAYVLLPGQVQMLITPSDATGLGKMMQWLGRQYVPYFNARHGRAGTLWQGRYRATLVDAGRYFLDCCRYLESAPVRAGLCGEPGQYRWSSYAHHAGIRQDPLITDHPLYWQLGNTPFDREAGYRRLMESGMSQAEISLFDQALRKGWPLGSDQFMRSLEKQTARRVAPAKRGRPPKPAPETRDS
ncbi:transposase [Noviherbaspirillum galbum]|uniref:Transposase n=1 Tax=Noviherbaspirillum galbum TaxID=2709383 RepID=A0A6B3SKM4_9BURK|nr:transposase [Noviherbaspirillum galbum]NEX61310.1 transposase [Noviherbaspirillum galbum]